MGRTRGRRLHRRPVAGAVLDRNGLRPGRWIQDNEGYVVLASETGVITVAPEHVQRKGRLAPGRCSCSTSRAGKIVDDEQVKRGSPAGRPTASGTALGRAHRRSARSRAARAAGRAAALQAARVRLLAGGPADDDRADGGHAARNRSATMGNDAALAVLSDRQPPLFSYFKQLFAQVTNPPIDPIRESVVMSLQAGVGAEVNLLSESPDQAHMLVMGQPILRNHELEKLRQVSHDVFDAATLDITWPIEQGPAGMEMRLHDLCDEARDYVDNGANILILSDRNLGPERVAMPSLLAVAAVHHHLVRRGTRLRTGLVIESGEPREIHDMATLIGYGAAAINPYVMFESLDELADRIAACPSTSSRDEAEKRIVKAIGKGLLKTISKMGISTIQSYCGAQIFEAVGLDRELIDKHFTGTASRIGGVGLDELSTEALRAPLPRLPAHRARPAAGRWRARSGAATASCTSGIPTRSRTLQHAVRSERRLVASYDEFARLANEEATRKAALRGLMELRGGREPLPLDQIEPADRDRQALHDRRDVPRLALAARPTRRSRSR